MKKKCVINENSSILSCDYGAFLKSKIKLLSKEIQDTINSTLITYREKLLFHANTYQSQLKTQIKSYKDDLKESSESIKLVLTEYSKENREDLIPLFHADCELNKNRMNVHLNDLREQLISFIQTQRCEILKFIDELSLSWRNIWKSLHPNESKEYNKLIGESISKFRYEINSILKKYEKRLKLLMTSYQNNILSIMDSFEKEVTDNIKFGNGKNIDNHNVKK